MLSAFVSIPAVKMDWLTYGVETAVVVSTKMAVKNLVPGSSAAVEFFEAAYHFRQGDIVGAAISTLSGAADLWTLGFLSSVRGVMTEAAKKSTVQGIREIVDKTVKEATDKCAPEMTHEVGKKVKKYLGALLGNEMARGLINKSVEKVYEEGTKNAAGGPLGDLFLKVISTGGNDVAKRIFGEYVGDGIQLAISQGWKQYQKLMFQFAKIAEEGAWKGLKKHIWKIIAKDVGVACAKGAINCIAKVNIPTEYKELLLRHLVELPSIKI